MTNDSKQATVTIAEFLTARLDEREPSVQLTIELTERAYPADEFRVRYQWARLTEHRTSGGYGHTFEPGAPTPEEALADIAAKRRIVERYREAMANASDRDALDPNTEALLVAFLWPLYDLAAVYSDHPDYLQEWKP